MPRCKDIYLSLTDKERKALVPGGGRGREPLPWCECHNRNPCPTQSGPKAQVDWYGRRSK